MKRYIILFHPRTHHEKNYRHYHIPYSILSIAAALEKHSLSLLYDNNLHQCTDYSHLDLPMPHEIELVGVSCMVGGQITDAMAFTAFIREYAPHAHIIWGGPCPTMLPALVLKEAGPDFIVIGQGEQTIVNLYMAIRQNQETASIPGVQQLKDGVISSGPVRHLTDLNSFSPYGNVYGQVKVASYIRNDEHIATKTLSYHSSQGCAYKCAFCCEPTLWGGKWIALSASRTADDIQTLVEHYGANGIKFYDSEFFIQKERALEFARILLDHKIGIQWGASIHPSNLMRFSDQEISFLRDSGLRRLLIGAESAVEAELRFIKKPMKTNVIREVAKRCALFDISASFTFVTGYPGFPLENIDRTLEFAEELSDYSPMHEAKVHFYAPFPGTGLYQTAIDAGFTPPRALQEWADYDYYYIQTPWVPDEYFKKARAFNEEYYPYLLADGMA